MCPYSAWKNLANSDPLGVAKNLPVFRFKNGKNSKYFYHNHDIVVKQTYR
jgi:hypothetical protein